MEAAPAVLLDAMVVLDGSDAVETLATVGHAIEFLKDQDAIDAFVQAADCHSGKSGKHARPSAWGRVERSHWRSNCSTYLQLRKESLHGWRSR